MSHDDHLSDRRIRRQGVQLRPELPVPILLALAAAAIALQRMRRGAVPCAIHPGRPVLGVPALLKTQPRKGITRMSTPMPDELLWQTAHAVPDRTGQHCPCGAELKRPAEWAIQVCDRCGREAHRKLRKRELAPDFTDIPLPGLEDWGE
jgi:hypothetical protein